MGELIAFEELVRARRQRAARAVHARCCALLGETVTAMRDALVSAPATEQPVRFTRLRKMEELAAYASAFE